MWSSFRQVPVPPRPTLGALPAVSDGRVLDVALLGQIPGSNNLRELHRADPPGQELLQHRVAAHPGAYPPRYSEEAA